MQLLNVFLCFIVNMFYMNITYILYIIATDKCYCDVTIYICGPQSGCYVYRERLGTIRVSVISIGRV